MTIRSVILFFCAALIIGACKNKVAQSGFVVLPPPPMGKYSKGYVPDSTDVYTVIKFDIKQVRNVFASSYRETEITPAEMKTVDSLIMISVRDYNAECKKKGWEGIMELKNYRRQLVGAIDTEGNKHIYVNAFTMWPLFENSWKKRLSYVSDGGSGFFHLSINLSKKRYYAFGVNGLA